MADPNYFHTNNFDQRTPPYLVFSLQSNGYSLEDVSVAYKKLIRIYHPDKHSASFYKHRFENVAKFINKKRSQILQELRGKTIEADNPPGDEVRYEVIPDSIVLFKADNESITSDHNSMRSSDNEDEDEDEDEDEERVDMEDEADTQGVQYHPEPPSSDAGEEEGSSDGNGNVSSADLTNTTGTGGMCECKNRAPHYHLTFQAPGMAPSSVRCPLCTITLPNTIANKSSLAQHVKTAHKQHCYVMDLNKKPPMSSKERVRKHRAKKNALKGALCPIG